MADGESLVIQLLKSIEARIVSMENRLNASAKDYVPRELYNNLVAEVADIEERFEIRIKEVEKEIRSIESSRSHERGRFEIIGQLAWPIVALLISGFATWLGLGKKE